MNDANSTEQDMEQRLVAVTLIALGNFSAIELAAFNTAITGWGRLQKGNLAFRRAVDAGLVKSDGSVCDVEMLTRALAHEITCRMDAGTFV